MANVTISIDDDLLKRCRKFAGKHNISLNSLIRRLLKNQVESNSSDWLNECFMLMDQVNVSSEGIKWRREELYD
jgi:hypothetical protein